MLTKDRKSIKELLDSGFAASLMEKSNVVGVGTSFKQIDGRYTNKPCIVCLVEKKVSKKLLKESEIIPSTVGSYATDVIETGKIEIQTSPTDKFRPAPGGVSVGHYAITAGTLGMWVKQADKVVMLSNNHVLANSNQASIGDNILQPGPYDGGKEVDTIAKLKDYATISWTGNNLVDAAIAEVDGDGGSDPSGCPFAAAVTKTFNAVYNLFGRKTRLQAIIPHTVVDNSIFGFDTMPTGIAEAYLGMGVKKSGRTTGITHGTVSVIDATVDVGYDGGKVARFVDQILTNDMSDGGDSGSVLLSEDGTKLVGLLFAGSSTITVFNRIQNVFDRFGLTLNL